MVCGNIFIILYIPNHYSYGPEILWQCSLSPVCHVLREMWHMTHEMWQKRKRKKDKLMELVCVGSVINEAFPV